MKANLFRAVHIAPVKGLSVGQNIFFLFLQDKNMVWVSIRAASNGYPQHMFSWKNKNIYTDNPFSGTTNVCIWKVKLIIHFNGYHIRIYYWFSSEFCTQICLLWTLLFCIMLFLIGPCALEISLFYLLVYFAYKELHTSSLLKHKTKEFEPDK